MLPGSVQSSRLARAVARRVSASGILLMLLSCLFFGTTGALVKVSTGEHEVPVMVTAFYRSLVGALVALPWALRQGVGSTRKGALVTRSVIGFVSMTCYFLSISMLPVGDAVMLAYSSPVLLAAMSPLLLRETPPWSVRVAIAIALLGVALIARPTGEIGLAGGLAGVASAFFAALAYVMVRRLGSSEPPERIIFWFSAISTALCTSALVAQGISPFAFPHVGAPAAVWTVLLLNGFVATLGQMLLTRAYSRQDAATVSTFSFATGIVAYMWQVAWFGVPLRASSVAGAAIIVVCGALVVRARGLTATTAPGRTAARVLSPGSLRPATEPPSAAAPIDTTEPDVRI